MKQFIVTKTGQWLRYHLVEGEDDPKGVYNPIVQQQLVHSSLNNPICTSNTYEGSKMYTKWEKKRIPIVLQLTIVPDINDEAIL